MINRNFSCALFRRNLSSKKKQFAELLGLFPGLLVALATGVTLVALVTTVNIFHPSHSPGLSYNER